MNKIYTPKPGSTRRLVFRLVRNYLSPYKKLLCQALLTMAAAAAMTAIFAKLIQPVMDDVLVRGDRGMILPVAGGVLVVFCLRGIFTYLNVLYMNKLGQNVISDIQNELFAKFMTLDLRFFHENPSGQLLSRVVNDVVVMRTAVTDSLTGIGKNFLTLVLLIGVMAHQDWRLTLATFAVFPLAAFFFTHLGRKLRKISGNIQVELGNLSTKLSQIFQGIRQVKAYGMEDVEKQRAAQAINHLRRLALKSIRVGQLSTPVNEILVGIAVFSIVVYGGYQVAGGALTAGQMMSFITSFGLAYEPIKKLASLNNSLQMGLGAAERVFDMLDRHSTIISKPGAPALTSKKPAIVFDQVTFRYHDGGENVIRNVSFKMEPGTVTALVGPSGSGKTTIMNLIPRFYDASEGSVNIDGVDIRDLDLVSLRQHIALVSQDVTIFDDTIRANIAYGNPAATDQEIVAAAVAAEADHFIRDFPHGYDTQTGENGVKLSGGQRQRIAIARAILRNAPILLLDEATSALDTESERAIQNTLARLQQGRTTLVIAHRLSTIQNADQIVVLDRGTITETGQHSELVGKSGTYARLHAIALS